MGERLHVSRTRRVRYRGRKTNGNLRVAKASEESVARCNDLTFHAFKQMHQAGIMQNGGNASVVFVELSAHFEHMDTSLGERCITGIV